MSGAIEARAQAIATMRVERVKDEVAAALGERRGIAVERDDRGVVAIGRRLRARWLSEPQLRSIGWWR